MPTILGPIMRLQVQISSLKVGEKPHRRYATDSLRAVPRLRVGRDGAVGLADGAELMDVHNAQHPVTKNEELRNSLSVGFSGHYADMRQRFGDHMATGVAGENIIVDLPRRVAMPEAQRGFVVLERGGRREKGRLVRVAVATPCKPFSGFALKGEVVPPETLKQTLAFLDGGTRGFYCSFDGPDGVVLELDDVLALA
jgi:hypothetical protein